MFSIRDNIEFILRQKRIKKKELAARMGVSPASLAYSLNRDMRVSTIASIAKAIGVPVSALFGEGDKIPNSIQEGWENIMTKLGKKGRGIYIEEDKISLPVHGFIKVNGVIYEVNSMRDIIDIISE